MEGLFIRIFFMSQQPANLHVPCQQKKNNVQVVQQ